MEAETGAVMTVLDTKDMAKILEKMSPRESMSPRRVRWLAARRGVGRQLDCGVWIFVPGDIEKLRPGPVGRPRLMKEQNNENTAQKNGLTP